MSENTGVLRAVYKDWEAGDLRAGQDLLDAEIESVWPTGFPSAGIYRGPVGHARAMRERLSPWEDFTLTAEGFIEVDDRVVVPSAYVHGEEEPESRWSGDGHTCGPCEAVRRCALRCTSTLRTP